MALNTFAKKPGARSTQVTTFALTMGMVLAPSAQAQVTPTKSSSGATDDAQPHPDIIVTAPRIAGSVVGDIPPELELDEAAVESYGASSISELLDALAPQPTSGRGRGSGGPVILLNGQRISSFSEIRDLPPEAILRVQILPEEVALKFGYGADQRVVNFILKPHFKSVTGEGKYGQSVAGGGGQSELQATGVRIEKSARTSLTVDYNHADSV